MLCKYQMTKKQIIEETIAHWKWMIAWAKKQPQDAVPNVGNMELAIGEDWSGEYCPLCNKYYCSICPLGIKFGACGDDNVKNLWAIVIHSTSYKSWVKNAEKFLVQLKKLRKELV